MNGRVRDGAARWWPIGAAVVVVAVAAAVVVGTAREENLQARPGDVVAADIGTAAIDKSTIRLPDGSYDVAVSKAVADPGAALDGRSAPDGGSWVAVRVGALFTKYYPQPATGLVRERKRPTISVELVAGGRSYPVPRDLLDDPYPGQITPGREAWVAVDGKPTDIVVAITYDGVRQTVRPADGKRDAGRASLLYAPAFAAPSPANTAESSCGPATYTDGFGPDDVKYPLRCDVSRYPALPYLPQLGWATSGFHWLVLSVRPASFATFEWNGPGDRTAFYSSYRDPDLTISVDGSRAVDEATTAPTLLAGNAGNSLAVFRVSSDSAQHRLAVTSAWTDLDTSDPDTSTGAPKSPDVTVSWTGVLR